MSVSVRELPIEEWDRLKGYPIAAAELPDPARCIVLVAEDENGDIVGHWALVMAPFMEGLWIAEDFRHTTAAAKLLVKMKSVLKDAEINQAFTLVQSNEVKAVAEHAGFQAIEGTLMMIEDKH